MNAHQIKPMTVMIPGLETLLSPPISTLIAYEQADLLKLARGLCGAVIDACGDTDTLDTTEWKFEMLSNQALRMMAAAEADAARLVVIAMRDGPALPEQLDEWMACWSPSSFLEPRSLVLLLATTPGEERASKLDLRGLVRKAGVCRMDFIAEFFEVPEGDPQWTPEMDADERKWIKAVAHSIRKQKVRGRAIGELAAVPMNEGR